MSTNDPRSETSPEARKRALAAACGLVAIALVVRVLSARGALWIDEILSLGLATSAEHAWDLVTRVHHDNNHVLNSLWMRLLGRDASAFLFRLPSVLAGTLAVALLARWRWQSSPREGLVAGALGCVSLPLVQYGSEARGYGFALAATFGAILLARRAEVAPCCSWAAAYWLVALVGVLSHLSFLFVLAGLAGWALLRVSTGGLRADAARLAKVHVVAVMIGVGAWLTLARDMKVAGGPDAGFPAPVAALSHVIGGASQGAGAWLAACGAVVAILGGLVVMARRGEADAGLVAACAVLAPLVVVVVLRPEYLVPRYFLLPTALVLAPIAALLSAGIAATRAVRAASLAAGALLVIAHAVQVAAAIRVGRGDGEGALALVQARAARRDVVTLGADNDFRLRVLLWHSRDALSRPPVIRHVPGALADADPPEWLLTEELRSGVMPPERLRIRGGASYEREAVFPHAGLSGITWGVFRRVDGD